MQTRQVIILFGGSFDPIHNGHLAVARYAFEHLSGKQLVFIPARRSPHKTIGPCADAEARLAMIRLAIAGHEGFSVSDCELHRPEPSYTIDTVRYFRDQFGPQAQLVWLVGADAIKDLEKWYRIDELLEMCRVCIMYRGGLEKPKLERLIPALGTSRVQRLQEDTLQTPLVEASSSEIRRRIAAGQRVDTLLPQRVLEYITQKQLYGAQP